MAWTTVNPQGQTIDIKKMENQAVLGTYSGKKEITTKMGKKPIWNFKDHEGEEFGIYGFTNLNRVMENLALGAYCRITYKGQMLCDTKWGRKPVHQVLVEVDDATVSKPIAPARTPGRILSPVKTTAAMTNELDEEMPIEEGYAE